MRMAKSTDFSHRFHVPDSPFIPSSIIPFFRPAPFPGRLDPEELSSLLSFLLLLLALLALLAAQLAALRGLLLGGRIARPLRLATGQTPCRRIMLVFWRRHHFFDFRNRAQTLQFGQAELDRQLSLSRRYCSLVLLLER